MTENEVPQSVRRLDYRMPDFLIDKVFLYVDIRDHATRVTSELYIRRNPGSADSAAPLRLNGVGISLLEILLDGSALGRDEYLLDEKSLTVPSVPDAFRLMTVGEIDPSKNTALEGLYVSHGMYCTQCEAEGFRRITWYIDRPDVMAVFETTIEADENRYPLLLSNGNRILQEHLANGRHRAVWQDPFPKPCYLFALVAADLSCREDRFTTRSGRDVTLQVYVEPHDLDKTGHAMESLKKAMRWDEEVYGLEYDLDIYMIVAVSHFNMGAMENKGLNIFNTSCVLANQRTQTDSAFQRVEAVVAHEYFHNWSGNRVTCRDWFQLSLKEGFTVFRDSEFSKDMHSRAVKRIEEVNFLRNVQFPEDAGPLAHPVRPEEYVEINNFYTGTVYEKGAEVVRMLHTLLGAEGFRRGSDLYFSRHDGQAATCDDFLRAMADANGMDLRAFARWYAQAGTPVLEVKEQWDARQGEYRLRFSQSCPPTPGQAAKEPFVIPVLFGLLDADSGATVDARHDDRRLAPRGESWLFCLDTTDAELVFSGLAGRPLPSLLRGFSAPAVLLFDYTDEQLAFLARHDCDPFNRWDAAQALYERVLLQAIEAVQAGNIPAIPAVMQALLGGFIAEATASDPALAAELLSLPGESRLADRMLVADPDAIRLARQAILRLGASALKNEMLALYDALHMPQWSAEPAAIARRACRHTVLGWLAALNTDVDVTVRLRQQYAAADNMTDELSALRFAVHAGLPDAPLMLEAFAQRWAGEALVMDQWFQIQATCPDASVLDTVRYLLDHPAFELTNPNRVRALIGAFANGNPVQFHRADGAGYRFVAEQLLRLDAVNPQMAARLAGCFSRWCRYDAARKAEAAAAIDRVLAAQGLSANLYEVLSKTRTG